MSRLDETRLENVSERGGHIICRCPACFEQGHDKTGNHLSVWPSGKFACVQFPGSEGKEHRKRIFALVGVHGYETLAHAIAAQELRLKMKATRRDPYNDQFVMVRFDDPQKGKKEFRPFRFLNSGWLAEDPPGKLPLFNLEQLRNRPTDRVFLVEGEKCACKLRDDLGLLAITSAHGAKAPHKTDWTPLAGRKVVILPDNDDEGERYASKAANALLNLEQPARIRIVHLPKLPAKGDCVEWLQSHNGQSQEETIAQLEGFVAAAAEEKLPPIAPQEAAVAVEQPRVAKVEPPQTPVTLTQWREVIAKNFPALASPAEICLSVEAQLLLNDVVNPFALALVDVPASGKTITLNFFKNPEELAYTTDYFSAAAFVSHATNVRREELANVDLLPRIRFKTAIVRELNSILGAKEDDLIKSLGILTRVLDGEGLQTDSGVHGRRGYSGDYTFMLLAGTTPIQPRVFKVMGNFGSRLFFLSLRSPDTDNKELIALNRGKDRKLKENECRKITENFLRTLWSANPQGVDWDKENDPDNCLEVIARCACLLASLRGAINVYRFDTTEGEEKLSHSVPVIEKPLRINCLFANLARAHALICGRRQLTEDDLWPVLEITFDSAPPSRAKIFRLLIEKRGRLSTSDVVDLLRCSSPTARQEMEVLSVLGVVDKWDEDEAGRPNTIITLAESFSWFTRDECSSLRKPRLGGQLSEEEIRTVFPNATEVAQHDRELDDKLDRDALRERISDKNLGTL